MSSRTTRRSTNQLHTIASILGFTNEVREAHYVTDNSYISVIVEHPSPDTDHTRVIVMHLSDRNIFYDRQFIGFPETLDNANITIDDDGEYIHLVISGPRFGTYYTLGASQMQTAA